YEVVSMANAEKAIAWVESHRPDLVLLDIQLPGMDGCTLAHILRQMPHLQSVPIVALTALVLEEERDQILAAGYCHGYIRKPVAMQELLDTLEDHLPRSPAPVPAPSTSRIETHWGTKP
ncbi:MAG: response regulator, partial [Pseudanabaenaceae cyanobacterium]